MHGIVILLVGDWVAGRWGCSLVSASTRSKNGFYTVGKQVKEK